MFKLFRDSLICPSNLPIIPRFFASPQSKSLHWAGRCISLQWMRSPGIPSSSTLQRHQHPHRWSTRCGSFLDSLGRLRSSGPTVAASSTPPRSGPSELRRPVNQTQTLSSACYPQWNGLAESAVKHVIAVFRQAREESAGSRDTLRSRCMSGLWEVVGLRDGILLMEWMCRQP